MKAFARIKNHYLMNQGFFPPDSFQLDRVDKIRHINTTGNYHPCIVIMLFSNY